MHKILVPITAAATAFLLAAPAGAHPVDGFITDIEGDANVINGQQLVDPDPTEEGVGTAPLSYGPADIRAVDLRTTYEATSIGDDGVDYRATGVQVIIKTEEQPRSDGPTLIYRLSVTVNGCNSFLQTYLRGPASAPIDPAHRLIQWRQLEADCPDGIFTRAMPFTKSIVTDDSIVMYFEYPILSAAQRQFLSPGVVLSAAQGGVRTFLGVATAPQMDGTVFGGDWVVGSDMPADIPCTTNCPP